MSSAFNLPATVAPVSAAPSETVIATDQLTKRFRGLTAVKELDLCVQAGDIYGFLGANGSGKTTTVRMLLGLILPTSGTVALLGSPMPSAAKTVLPHVGALVEAPGAYGHLSGTANLALMDASGPDASRRTRKARIAEVLELVGLDAVGRRPVRNYSLGMRQRLGLAQALLRSPRLLILDEPTNGLDPRGIHEMRDLLRRLNQAGTTIFLSSHLLAEVEQLCTRVGVLDRGRLVLQDDLAALTAPTGNTVLRTPDADEAVRLLAGRVVGRDADELTVAGLDPAELNWMLVSKGLRVIELRQQRPTLEERVLQVSGPGSDQVSGS